MLLFLGISITLPLRLGNKMISKENVWANVKIVVKSHGLSMKEVATTCNIPYKTFMNWRARSIMPDIMDAKNMANVVGCSIDELFFDEKPNVVNEGNDTKLVDNIRTKAPELYRTLVATYGYEGEMANEIRQETTTTRA